jgi:predicted hotdog family 3-hydroxylacyl-ACP dehydratase
MLLLDAIVAHGPDETTCAARASADSVMVKPGGRLPRWMALEYMAQTVAVHAGLCAWARREPIRLGFLIGSRRVDFHDAPRPGRSLLASARRIWGQASLGVFACWLRERDTGELLAEGQLSVSLSDADGHPAEGSDR